MSTILEQVHDDSAILFQFSQTIAILDLASMTWRYPYQSINGTLAGQLSDHSPLTSGQTLTKWNAQKVLSVMSDEGVESALIVTPNPVKHKLVIHGLRSNGRITITDIAGRSVTPEFISETELDVSTLSPGAYLLHEESGSEATRSVLIVKE